MNFLKSIPKLIKNLASKINKICMNWNRKNQSEKLNLNICNLI
jgi:hypothetical protein